MSGLPLSINYRLVAALVPRPDQGVIEIYGARSTIRVQDPTGRLHSFLCRFTGFLSLRSLLDSAAGESGVHPEQLLSLVEALVGEGAITPASDLWRLGHDAGSNPQALGVSLLPSEIVSLSRTRSFPRANLHADDATSHLERLGSLRRSARQFDRARQVESKLLQKILRIAYSADIRSTPSAGGLNPCSVFVLRREIKAWSLDYWDPISGELQPRELPQRLPVGSPALRHALESEDDVHGAGAIVVITAEPGVQTRKYGNRGYRYSLLDAGHISQMVLMAAVEHELATLEWGAFRDAALSKVLGLPGSNLPLICIALGWPSEEGAKSRTLERLVAWQEKQDGGFDFTGSKEPKLNNDPAGIVLTQVDISGGSAASGGVRQRDPSAIGRATGAGWTSRTSRIRALGEAIERTASGFVKYEAECSSELLPPGEVFDALAFRPPDLPKFKDNDVRSRTFSPYSPSASYRWRKGQRADGTDVWIPIELVYYPVTAADVVGPLCGTVNSNGVAAAASISSARKSAFLELVERDAFARAWLDGRPPTRVIGWPDHLQQVVDKLQESGSQVDLLAFTTHVPTAGVANRQPSKPALSFGMATREVWEDAVEKALQEALSQRVSYSDNPQIADEPNTGPLHHFQQYCRLENRHKIDWFFEASESDEPPALTGQRETLWEGTVFVDLSHDSFPLSVIRALSVDLIPIWFGPDWVPSSCKQTIPHFFA